jgi:hypothetical protein
MSVCMHLDHHEAREYVGGVNGTTLPKDNVSDLFSN